MHDVRNEIGRYINAVAKSQADGGQRNLVQIRLTTMSAGTARKNRPIGDQPDAAYPYRPEVSRASLKNCIIAIIESVTGGHGSRKIVARAFAEVLMYPFISPSIYLLAEIPHISRSLFGTFVEHSRRSVVRY